MNGDFGALTVTIAAGTVGKLRVWVNGNLELTDGDFRAGLSAATRSMQLATSNQVRVDASSVSGATITVQIARLGGASQFRRASIPVTSSDFGGIRLFLGSALDLARVVSGTTADVIISDVGPQLIYLTDNAQEVRGLSITLPKASAPTDQPVDVLSTVTALVYASPGIAETDPLLAPARLAAVEAQPCVGGLTGLAAPLLAAAPLRTVVADPAFAAAFDTCVSTTSIALGTSGVSTARIAFQHTLDKVTVIVDTGATGRSVSFENQGMRFVEVYSTNAGTGGSTPTFVTLLPSATPLSWGSLFTLSPFAPSVGGDAGFPSVNSAAIDYWMRGPGLASTSTSPPTGTFPGSAWAGTVTFNVVFPIIDLIAGAQCFGATPSLALSAVGGVLSKAKLGMNFVTLFSGVVDKRTLATSAINFTVGVMGVILSDPTIVLNCGLRSVAGNVLFFLKVPATIMSAGNLALFAIDLFTLPSTTKFATPTFATGVVDGIVGSSNGGGIANAIVTLSPGSYSTTTAADGSYSFGQVGVGSYVVSVSSLPQSCVAPSPQPAVVAVGASTSVNFGVNCTSAQPVLVAHYPLDGNTDDVTANPINGTSANATYVPGRVGSGSAIRFAGGASYMQAQFAGGAKLAFETSDQFTVALWYRADQLPSGPDNAAPFALGFNVFGVGIQVQADGTPLVNACKGNCVSAFGTAGSIVPGQWFHVAQVYDGAAQRMQIFVNGSPYGATTVPIYPPGNATDTYLHLGSYPYAPQFGFRGSVDDLRIYKGALSAAEITALANIPQPPAPPLPSGLAAFYPLDGNGTDASGNGNHGVLNGPTAASGHTGQAGTALSFAGSADVIVPSNPILKGLTGDMTLVYWVKRGSTAITSTMIPVSRREPSNRIHFLTYAQPGGFGFQCCSAGGSATGMFYTPSGNGLTVLNDGQWHQIAVTRRFGLGGFTELYVDGNPVPGSYTSGTAADLAASMDAALLIGRQDSGSPGQFAGFLDNVYIFNTILTPTQIQSLP